MLYYSIITWKWATLLISSSKDISLSHPTLCDMFSVPAVLRSSASVQSRVIARTTKTVAASHPAFHSLSTPSLRLESFSRQFSSSTANMAPAPKQYDYIVIGGGSGGSGAARRASGWYKKKTCIIDAGISGGCCVNVGFGIQCEAQTTLSC